MVSAESGRHSWQLHMQESTGTDIVQFCGSMATVKIRFFRAQHHLGSVQVLMGLHTRKLIQFDRFQIWKQSGRCSEMARSGTECSVANAFWQHWPRGQANRADAQVYDFRLFLFTVDHGFVLIMTRLPSLALLRQSIEVARLGSDQALEFLVIA